MNTRTAFSLGILAGLILASVTLVGLIFFWRTTFVPVITPSTQVGSAQPQTDRQNQVDRLIQRIDKLEKDQAFTLRDIVWKMDQKLFYLAGLAFAIAAITTFFGYRTYKDLDGTIREKVNSTLEKELYQLDPTLLAIHVHEGRQLDKVWQRLELTGLENLSWYRGFDDGHAKALLKGITVVPIENDQDEREFRRFLESYKTKLDPAKAAFILYAPRREHPVSDQTLSAYDNLVTANMPATVASMVLVVGRGLKPTQ